MNEILITSPLELICKLSSLPGLLSGTAAMKYLGPMMEENDGEKQRIHVLGNLHPTP